jgi:hypothetical protein
MKLTCLLSPVGETTFTVTVSCNWVLNEADPFMSSSILIDRKTVQSIYTQMTHFMVYYGILLKFCSASMYFGNFWFCFG